MPPPSASNRAQMHGAFAIRLIETADLTAVKS